jgi:hypothetical protein
MRGGRVCLGRFWPANVCPSSGTVVASSWRNCGSMLEELWPVEKIIFDRGQRGLA